MTQRTIANHATSDDSSAQSQNELAFRECVGNIPGVKFQLAICSDAGCSSVTKIEEVDKSWAVDPVFNSVFNSLQPGRYSQTGTSISFDSGKCEGNAIVVGQLCRAFTSHLEAALVKAIKTGDQPTVQEFLDHGVTLGYDYTALGISARAMSPGDDAFPNGSADFSPILTAAGAGQVSMIRFLVNHGAKVNVIEDNITPLAAAINHGNDEALQALLEAGANPDMIVGEAMSLAAEKGDRQAVRMLATHGARLDAVESVHCNGGFDCQDLGASAMEIAARKGDTEMVQLLY